MPDDLVKPIGPITGPAALARHRELMADPARRAARLPNGQSLSTVNTASPADPFDQRRHDDPWRYAALVTDAERASMQTWAFNYWTDHGRTFPVPSALYDLLKASGVDVTYMHPVKATFF